MLLKLLMTATLLWLPAQQVWAGHSYPVGDDAVPGAEYVGSDSCLDCHDDVGEAYIHSPHKADLALPVPGTEAAGCEACHGPGSLHIENDGDGYILGLDFMSELDADGQVSMCLQCHSGVKSHWFDGPHAGSEATCAACHADQVHYAVDGAVRPQADYRNPSEFCLQCHQTQIAEFRLPFRHRALEGEVGCNDCHSPHGATASGNLFAEMNATCLGCHAEMAGPFVFEHEGTTAEDCITCHRPHGSVNDKMLVTDTNSLCLQCHYEPDFITLAGVPHASNPGSCTDCHTDGVPSGKNPHGGSQVRCFDCHADVHGSNISPTYLNF